MSDFPTLHRNPEAVLLSEIASWLDAPVRGEGDPRIRRLAPVFEAGPEELGLLAARGYLAEVATSRAGALLVSEELVDDLPPEIPPALVVPDAHRALARILERMHPSTPTPPSRHPTAVVSPEARLGEEVHLGPYAVVEEGAEIGDRVRIGAHAVVGAGVQIGDDSHIFPHAVLYPGAVLGRRVQVHSGARVAVDGFGYVVEEGRTRKVPQVGRCVLEDDVEIGANTTLDRGSIGDTRIGSSVKIDNQVQVGHNVRIGASSILAAQAGIAGSTRIGQGVLIGGQVGIGGHVTIGDGARLSAQAGIIGDIDPGETVMGFPARPRMEYLRMVAAQKQVTALVRRIRELERRVE